MENRTITNLTTLSELERHTTTISFATSANPLRKAVDNFISVNKSKIRSLLKAVSYRFLGTLATVIISYILTREISLSLSIGALELVGKIILFYLHERLWDKIS